MSSCILNDRWQAWKVMMNLNKYYAIISFIKDAITMITFSVRQVAKYRWWVHGLHKFLQIWKFDYLGAIFEIKMKPNICMSVGSYHISYNFGFILHRNCGQRPSESDTIKSYFIDRKLLQDLKFDENHRISPIGIAKYTMHCGKYCHL